MKYQDVNAQTVDQWAREGWEWGRPVDHESCLRAKAGEWEVLLTPTKPVPHRWFGNLKGKRILGLASGGGQQMPIFALLGAECTVMDYSPVQLESERAVALREGYEIDIVRGDMSERFPFEDEAFDLIFHPVSNVYVREVEPVFRECFRVLKKGGILLSGLDNGMNFALDETTGALAEKLPFDPLADGKDPAELLEAGDGVQFSHTVEEQLGGQLRAGFVLTDLYEDTNGSGILHEYGIPTFIASRAVKP